MAEPNTTVKPSLDNAFRQAVYALQHHPEVAAYAVVVIPKWRGDAPRWDRYLDIGAQTANRFRRTMLDVVAGIRGPRDDD